jgi:hypothetical protein
MLFHFQRTFDTDRITIPESDHRKLVIAHSLPKIVGPEIEDPITLLSNIVYRQRFSKNSARLPDPRPVVNGAQTCINARTVPHIHTN